MGDSAGDEHNPVDNDHGPNNPAGNAYQQACRKGIAHEFILQNFQHG